MRKDEYGNLFELEDTYWRYVGLRNIVASFLDKFYVSNAKSSILDAGCGTGAVLLHLKKYGKSFGIDISKYALDFCKKRNLDRLSQACLTALPFKNNSFDLIVSLDAICQLSIDDDSKALEEMRRVLKENGRIIINVPAYNFLRSNHDEAVHDKQRYTNHQIRRKMEKSQFKIERITHWNTFLFPVIAFIRVIRKIIKTDNYKSDLRPLPPLLNRFLTKIMIFEVQLLSKINFPYGLSIICVVKKLL